MMLFSLCLAFFAIFLTGISQVLLKSGAQYGYKNCEFYAPYLNIATITAYIIFIFITIISVIALHDIPLKVFCTLTAFVYIVVAVFSKVILKEKLSKYTIIGLLIIIFGIIIFNM